MQRVYSRKQILAKGLLAGFLVFPISCIDAAKSVHAQAVGSAVATPQDFSQIAKNLIPAVVNVSSSRRLPSRPSRMFPQLPPPFDEFFRQFGPQDQEGEGPPEQEAPLEGTALGSGFIIDPSGYVVTNAHVIEEAEEISVILHDESRYTAKLVGKDDRTDLALLKIETTRPLPFVRWGDSDKVEVGEWILAIGNPFGLGGSVTSGIISAKARNIGIGPYDAFLQTDASINRGNSGGPMFNMKGEVIGINTAIFSPTGGNIGIGFATPSSLAQSVIRQLREKGRVERGWLGVTIQGVTEDAAQAMGLPNADGALVSDVTPGGPADKAGIQPGDVILQFDGRKISASERLPLLVAESPIGKKAEVILLRNNQQNKLTVTIGDLSQAPPEASGRPKQPQIPPPSLEAKETLGLVLAPLSPEARRRYGIAENVSGVLVDDVARDSPAGRKGLRAGDVIIQAGGRKLTTPDDLRTAIAAARNASRAGLLLLVHRQGVNRFVTVSLKNG